MNRNLKIAAIVVACLLMAGNNGCPFEWREALEGVDEELSSLTWKRADYVIGQPSRDSDQGSRPPSPNTLREPSGLAYSGGWLFIADAEYSRVMAYDGIPVANDADADFVLGQPDLESEQRRGGADGLSVPTDVVAGNWGLAITDTNSDRVVVFNTRPDSGPRDADRVLGQPALDQNLGPGCAEDALNTPWSIQQADERLIVSDYNNNRLMIWDRDAASGSAATQVVGQADFLSCQANRGQGVAAGDSLSQPAGLWTDGSRLAVADRGNHRVLLWDQFPLSGEPADVVIGQPDLSTAGANSDGLSHGLREPTDVFWDGRRLFVADSGNHRVLVYGEWPESNQPLPDAVLGQPDRNTASSNNTGDGTSINARSLNRPEAVWSNRDRLLISDTFNNRVMIYSLGED